MCNKIKNRKYTEVILQVNNHYAKLILEKRLQDGLSQEVLANKLGISVDMVDKLENALIDIEKLAPKTIRMILLYLSGKIDTKLDVQLDWVGMTFQTLDYKKIISEVLCINIDMMEQIDSGHNNYKAQYKLNDITVYYHDTNEKMGVHVKLSGNGCREFENLLAEQERDWHSFFKTADSYKGRASRIDIAINDYVKIIDIKELIKKSYLNEIDNENEINTKFRTVQPKHKYDPLTNEDKEVTLYFGSRQSELLIRFYEKDLEQQETKKIKSRELCLIKNRYECQFGKDKARKVMADYIETGQFETIAFDTIYTYISFLDRDDKLPKQNWKINDTWREFIRDAKIMPFKTNPIEFSYGKTKSWLENYCAQSIYVMKKVDHLNKTSHFLDMIENAKGNLDKRHEQMIKVATAKPKDLIVQKA